MVGIKAVAIWLCFKKRALQRALLGKTNLLLGRTFITSRGKNGVLNERDSQIILVLSNDF